MEARVSRMLRLSSQWEALEFAAPVDKPLDALPHRHAAVVPVEPPEPTKISQSEISFR